MFIELNFLQKKWLLCCTCNPNRYNISNHLDLVRRSLDLHSAEYEHFIMVGDFNREVTQTSMKVFCNSYEFKNLIKDATCYKNPENPSCINLILTNNPNSFQNSGVIETSLSDFHKMLFTVMKTTSEKLKPNIINYRDYRKFSNDKFRKIFFRVYQLKILELTVMAWKRFCKYVLRIWMNLHHKRKSIPEETICYL